jgi:hypothetical protein
MYACKNILNKGKILNQAEEVRLAVNYSQKANRGLSGAAYNLPPQKNSRLQALTQDS